MSTGSRDDALVADLRALGRAVTAEPSDGLAAAVLTRLEPAPRRRRVARPAAIAVVAVLLGLLAAPPVRAAVVEWFRLAGAVVHLVPGSGAGTAPPPPSATGSATPARLPFRTVDLPGLGEPDGVEVSPDRRRLSRSWDRPGGTVRLDQFDAGLDYAFAKTAPELDWVDVGGRSALWFERPHELVLLEPDGTPSPGTTRIAGHTLVWATDDSVLRLEGALTRAEAVALATAARPG